MDLLPRLGDVPGLPPSSWAVGAGSRRLAAWGRGGGRSGRCWGGSPEEGAAGAGWMGKELLAEGPACKEVTLRESSEQAPRIGGRRESEEMLEDVEAQMAKGLER